MEILKFKTNVTDEAGVQNLRKHFDQEESISRWQLDAANPDHVLSVSGHEVSPQRIKNLIREAGYSAQLMRVFGAGGGDL